MQYRVSFKDPETGALICWAVFTSKSQAEMYHKQAVLEGQLVADLTEKMETTDVRQ